MTKAVAMISRRVGLGRNGQLGLYGRNIVSPGARSRPTVAATLLAVRRESTTTTAAEDTTGHIKAADNESIIWVDSKCDDTRSPVHSLTFSRLVSAQTHKPASSAMAEP